LNRCWRAISRSHLLLLKGRIRRAILEESSRPLDRDPTAKVGARDDSRGAWVFASSRLSNSCRQSILLDARPSEGGLCPPDPRARLHRWTRNGHTFGVPPGPASGKEAAEPPRRGALTRYATRRPRRGIPVASSTCHRTSRTVRWPPTVLRETTRSHTSRRTRSQEPRRFDGTWTTSGRGWVICNCK